MIKTVADLLNQLQIKEKQLLKEYAIIKHPGLIGDMYEGLTKDILDKAVFDGLDLRVTAGKIRNLKGEFSDEIDCMVVIGEGEKIPYTGKHIYNSDKVIAVIQVKKNLFSKDIADAYENLRSVMKITDAREGEEYHGRLLRDSWRAIFSEELPKRTDLDKMDFNKQLIYHTLLLEAFYPARIVWGYEGFKSEFTLREKFLDYLQKNLSSPKEYKYGFGPVNFPNLLICDKYSLIKTNGIPYAYPVFEDGYWPFFMSSSDNPINFLLEVIWTRLHYMFRISAEIFGEDLKVEQLNGLLHGRCLNLTDMTAWQYEAYPLTKEELEIPKTAKEWEPVFVDQLQFNFFNYLGVMGTIDCEKDEDIKKDILTYGQTLKSFLRELKKTGLVDIKGTEVRFITEQCVCGIALDGRFYCGEDKTGRVSRWLLKQLKGTNQ